MKKKKFRDKSLFQKIVDIHHEEAMKKRAMRALAKQEWSIEFLCWLCAKAARLTGSPVEITVESPAGQKALIKSQDLRKDLAYEDSILDRLDDTAAVEAYIAKHATR